jgi:hypothetical protein
MEHLQPCRKGLQREPVERSLRLSRKARELIDRLGGDDFDLDQNVRPNQL